MHMTGGDFDGNLNMLSFCPELIALAEETGQAVAAANMADVAEALCNLRFKGEYILMVTIENSRIAGLEWGYHNFFVVQ